MSKRKLIGAIVTALCLCTALSFVLLNDHNVSTKALIDEPTFVSGTNGVAAEKLKEQKKEHAKPSATRRKKTKNSSRSRMQLQVNAKNNIEKQRARNALQNVELLVRLFMAKLK